MKNTIIRLMIHLILGCVIAGCTAAQPTADLAATVEAAVSATVEAQKTSIATVQDVLVGQVIAAIRNQPQCKGGGPTWEEFLEKESIEWYSESAKVSNPRWLAEPRGDQGWTVIYSIEVNAIPRVIAQFYVDMAEWAMYLESLDEALLFIYQMAGYVNPCPEYGGYHDSGLVMPRP